MIDKLIEAVAISLDNALYKGGFLVQNDGEAKQIAKVALTAIESQGFRVVPVEPTSRMLADGAGAHLGQDPDFVRVAAVTWRAMLEAAPKVTGGGE